MRKINIFWFRRDLRFHDNAGLYQALAGEYPVVPLFIFDKNILDKIENKKDARVAFIFNCVTELQQVLHKQAKSSILIKHGKPLEVFQELLQEYELDTVFTNRDYEPYALSRDQEVASMLRKNNIDFRTYKDHLIFEKEEVMKKDGKPYTVFTPYSRRWLEKLHADGLDTHLSSYPSEDHFDHFHKTKPFPFPSLSDLGFEKTNIPIPGKIIAQGLIRQYDKTRDFPAKSGTSRLGIHFRFGTISIREKARNAYKLNKTFLNELIWRDFYAMILFHFPYVAEQSFRAKYDQIEWRNNEKEFEKWCEGKTGYPIVDAGMRELNTTGYMHNRVRMITASFLTKHLLIDWRWGEAYFAKKLLDFDLASNNGGWQWAAGCGTDAAPYFRVFNPTTQQKKFDKDFEYIKTWIPEYDTNDYPAPIVEHKFARERCLRVYKEGLNRGN